MYSEEQRLKVLNDTNAVYHAGIYKVKLKQKDSLSGKISYLTRKDSMVIRAKF